jgi:hypothetical protein
LASARDLLHYRPVRALACRIAAGYIRLVEATGRWTIENADAVSRCVAEGKPFIACFWHGRLLMIPHAWAYTAPMHILISHHRDGRLIAGALDRLGIRTISGSSSRGGDAAVLRMVRALRRGEYVGLTPDGPRGPRMRASLGVIRTAQRTGVPIVPVSFAASRRKVLRSWDRFVLALPFARGVIGIGDFIEVPPDADAETLERQRRRLEDDLNTLTRELDARFGFDAIEAAPPAESPTPLAASGLGSVESGR